MHVVQIGEAQSQKEISVNLKLNRYYYLGMSDLNRSDQMILIIYF